MMQIVKLPCTVPLSFSQVDGEKKERRRKAVISCSQRRLSSEKVSLLVQRKIVCTNTACRAKDDSGRQRRHDVNRSETQVKSSRLCKTYSAHGFFHLAPFSTVIRLNVGAAPSALLCRANTRKLFLTSLWVCCCSRARKSAYDLSTLSVL